LCLDNMWLESLASRPEWLRVLGFGLAELPDAERDSASSGVFPSSAGRAAGSAEQLPRLRLRADIYAFGLCLYQLASGSLPAWPGPPGSDREAMAKGMAKGLAGFTAEAKDSRRHIDEGVRKGLNWKTEIPVTDPMSPKR